MIAEDIDAVTNYELNKTPAQRAFKQLHRLFSAQPLVDWSKLTKYENHPNLWAVREQFMEDLKVAIHDNGWPLVVSLVDILRENLLISELVHPIQRMDHLTRFGRILWATQDAADALTIDRDERRALILEFIVFDCHQFFENIEERRNVAYYHDALFDELCNDGLAPCRYNVPIRLIEFVQKLIGADVNEILMAEISTTSNNHELLKIDLNKPIASYSIKDVLTALSEWLRKQPILRKPRSSTSAFSILPNLSLYSILSNKSGQADVYLEVLHEILAVGRYIVAKLKETKADNIDAQVGGFFEKIFNIEYDRRLVVMMNAIHNP